MRIPSPLIILVTLILFLNQNAYAQKAESHTDSLAKYPDYFLKSTSAELQWEVPARPEQIIGPIYYVGTQGLGSYLITSPQGHILLYTGMPGSGPMIEKSIRELGFNPKDIKYILTGHAHADHVGGHAYMKKISGAQVVIMDKEKELLESGGKTDFFYGNYPSFYYEPVKVDKLIHDEDEVRLGNIVMKALLTAGHTKGSTSWVMTVTDNNTSYKLVFPDGTGINSGYKLLDHPSYPGILADYENTFRVLNSLEPDIWLTPHPEACDYQRKINKKMQGAPSPFIDPQGYKKRIGVAQAKFNDKIKTEKESLNH
jgi:metallo-beta-lactamase class B